MRLPILYIRTCFIFTLVEALMRLLSAGHNVFQGKSVLWSCVYFILYSLMLFLAFRLWHGHHLPSAKGLITLRIGLAFSLIVHHGMIRPLPPISILIARELLPAFQLYLACKARASILKLKARSTTV